MRLNNFVDELKAEDKYMEEPTIELSENQLTLYKLKRKSAVLEATIMVVEDVYPDNIEVSKRLRLEERNNKRSITFLKSKCKLDIHAKRLISSKNGFVDETNTAVREEVTEIIRETVDVLPSLEILEELTKNLCE